MARQWTPEEIQRLKKEYLFFTHRELAGMFNVSYYTVRHQLRKQGLLLSEDVQRDRMRASVLQTNAQKNKSRKNPFPGASIYVLTYFAKLRKEKRLDWRTKTKPEMTDILKDICEALGEAPEEVKGERQLQKLVICRQLFCWITKIVNPQITHKEIAYFLGYAQHSMVTVAIRKIDLFFKTNDPKFMEAYYTYRQHTKIYTKTKYKDYAN